MTATFTTSYIKDQLARVAKARTAGKEIERERLTDSDGCKGLEVAIHPTGTAAFSLRFSVNGKQRGPFKIGVFHPETFNVAHARKAAAKMKADAGNGIDVIGIRTAAVAQQIAGSATFNEVADLFIDHLKAPVMWRGRMVPRRSSWEKVGGREIEGASPRYQGGYLKRARAMFGSRPIASITRMEIKALLKGIEAEGMFGLAVNLRSALFGLFKWACGEEIIQNSPCTNLGERPQLGHRERALSAEEIAALWRALDAVDCPVPRIVALAFKLMLCTGLRGGEVCGAQREWFVGLDGAEPMYCMPDWFTKAGRANFQPLNSLAVEIVREIWALRDATTGPLFPAGVNGAEFKRHMLTDYMHDRGYNGWEPKDGVVRQHGLLSYLGFSTPWRPHDLRHTAATLLRRNRVAPADVSFMLDHAVPGVAKVTEGYTNLVAEENAALKRPTLDRLGELLRAIITPAPVESGNVVKISRRAA